MSQLFKLGKVSATPGAKRKQGFSGLSEIPCQLAEELARRIVKSGIVLLPQHRRLHP